MLHTLEVTQSRCEQIPNVDYGGRCPYTGRELYLLPDHYCLSASKQLMEYLKSQRGNSSELRTDWLYEEANGKMFGVLACRTQGEKIGYLRAFSGEWENGKQPDGWVPSSGFFTEYETEKIRVELHIDVLTQRIKELEKQPSNLTVRREVEEIKIDRANLSRALTRRIHQAYRFDNALGEILPLTKVETGGTQPPTGMGDCCAPKLIQYAIRQGLRPLSMIEFWWGASSVVHPRLEGHFYSSCQPKCYPILGFLLRGISAAEVRT